MKHNATNQHERDQYRGELHGIAVGHGYIGAGTSMKGS